MTDLLTARAALLATLQAITDAMAAPPADRPKKRRRGPPPLPLAERRRHRVSVYLNDAELAALLGWVFPGQRVDAAVLGVRRELGRYMRDATFDRLPPTIPEVNREAWAALARTAANLNQIAHLLNAGDALPLAEVRATLDAFRRDLIGVKHDAEDAEDESEG